MIEGYSTEEVVECYQEYLKVQRGIGNPNSRRKGRLAGKGTVVEKHSSIINMKKSVKHIVVSCRAQN
jgi:hypothetical protein